MPMARDTTTAPVQALKLGTTQSISYSATAGNSLPVAAQWVRVMSTTYCHIRIGTGATAVVTDAPLPANTIEYLQIYPGERVSAVRDAADGTLFVTEVS